MTEDKFWDVYLLFLTYLVKKWNQNNLMDFDWDTTAVVVDGDRAVLTINMYLDRVHGRVSDLVVGRIDKNFIKNLVETRNYLHIPDG
jgi:hypothetical protein